MKITEIAALVNGQIYGSTTYAEEAINHAYASNADEDILKIKGYKLLLITDRNDAEIITIAQQAELHHVLIVKCKQATQAQLEAAKANNITLIACELSMFMAVATLSDAGMLPVYPQ